MKLKIKGDDTLINYIFCSLYHQMNFVIIYLETQEYIIELW